MRDNGIGIEPEQIERIFTMFYQSDRSLDRSYGGLGLGLALVKGLIELHGGQVHAKSDGANRGAEFTIELALCTVPALQPEEISIKPMLGIIAFW